jgi:hypothetical protein
MDTLVLGDESIYRCARFCCGGNDDDKILFLMKSKLSKRCQGLVRNDVHSERYAFHFVTFVTCLYLSPLLQLL